MTIKHLQSFLLIADKKSFSKAAKTLFLTPSALTQQINALEHEIGFKLFIRHNKGVVLTDAGSSFYQDTKTIVEMYQAAVEKGCEMAGYNKGVLRIGVWGGPRNIIIPASIREFSKVCPTCQLEFISTDVENNIDMLRKYLIDVAFHYGSMKKAPEGLLLETLCSEAPCCILPKSSHLANRHSLGFSDLCGEKLVLQAAGCSPFEDLVRKHIADHGLDITIIDGKGYETGLAQIQTLNAVSLSPPLFVFRGDDFVCKPFRWQGEKVSIELIMRNEENPLLKFFSKAAKKAIAILHKSD